MPTKKKRVGFIPREDVMRRIDKWSVENNLSNSKIISILVEEALSMRGIFNKKNGKASQTFEFDKNNSNKFIDNEKFSIDTKLGNNFKTSKQTISNEANKDPFDLETYKKFLSFLKFQELMDKYDTK